MSTCKAFLLIIDEIINYVNKKELSAAQDLINAAREKLRKTDFRNNITLAHELTKDLALTKNKLVRLKEKVKNFSSEYDSIINPLIIDLERRICILREKRNCKK